MDKILLGTANEGKIKEMKNYLADLDFEVLSLDDMDEDIEDPAEPADTIEENALLKSRYYAKKTNLPTLSDDGGLFVDAFDGWPGVRSARVADSSQERRNIILNMLEKKEVKDRGASFRTVVSFYDPKQNINYSSMGITEGKVVDEIKDGQIIDGFGYDPIFHVDDAGKTYAQMTTKEKNEVSHRGKALQQVKYFLESSYGIKQFIVPYALIYKDGKILMNLRNDPHRKNFHQTWEFPGGGIDRGEDIEEALIREAEEETGYQVEIISQLPNVIVQEEKGDSYNYQVCLVPFLCAPRKKVSEVSDNEVLKSKWYSIDSLSKVDNLFPRNEELIKSFLPNLKQEVEKNNL